MNWIMISIELHYALFAINGKMESLIAWSLYSQRLELISPANLGRDKDAPSMHGTITQHIDKLW
jgi:hypothetical protein